jgi:hypothetical protein
MKPDRIKKATSPNFMPSVDRGAVQITKINVESTHKNNLASILLGKEKQRMSRQE